MSSICNVVDAFGHPGTSVAMIATAMRRILMAFAILLSTMPALAAGSQQQSPDYSRDTILKILHDADEEQAPFRFEFGRFTINTRTTRYHLAWLPLLAPIAYSGPHGAGQLPNPFVLTNTEYAWRPHQYRATPDLESEPRDFQREYKRTAKIIAQFNR